MMTGWLGEAAGSRDGAERFFRIARTDQPDRLGQLGLQPQVDAELDEPVLRVQQVGKTQPSEALDCAAELGLELLAPPRRDRAQTPRAPHFEHPCLDDTGRSVYPDQNPKAEAIPGGEENQIGSCRIANERQSSASQLHL